MKRKILVKIGGEGQTPSPSERLWAGMQYEDNATEVVFDLSAVGTEKALYRIDFNSVTAGYFPSENLTPDSMPSIRRSIPKYLTQYGGELEAVAVITPLTDGDEPTGEVLSYPVTLYFTEVSRNGEGEAEFIPSLSAMEEAVRRAVRETEDLISSVEQRIESGEFVGEKGDRGEKGEAGEDAITDQTYNPESENAQSGRAVAEAVSTKASLQIKEIDVEGAYTLTAFIEGSHIYELSEVSPIGDIMCELYFTNGMGIRVEPNKYPFTIGKKYLIETHLDDNGVDYIIDVIAEVIDLEDKVNITDFDEALANVGGNDTFVTVADITLDEAVNTITIDETTFPNITKLKDFYIALAIEKPAETQSGNLLIKGVATYSTPCFGVIKTWNHTSYVVKGNFYSKYFDNDFRFNSCAEVLSANATTTINVSTTTAQITEPLKGIIIQCATATSKIPIGSKITIKGYVGK